MSRKILRKEGFTLVEMLLVVCVLSIVSAYAVGSFSRLLLKVRVESTVSDLLSALQVGRSMAMSRRQAVVVCGSTDGTHCTQPWQDRLLVFVDRNRNSWREPDEEILSDTRLPGGGVAVYWSAFSNPAALQWRPWAVGAAVNGTFTVCNERKDDDLLRQYIVNRAGRIRPFYPARSGGEALVTARRTCGW